MSDIQTTAAPDGWKPTGGAGTVPKLVVPTHIDGLSGEENALLRELAEVWTRHASRNRTLTAYYEARITDMKGLQVPFADDPLIFHRVIRFDDNTPIRAFNSTTIDMHSRNGLISECMNAEDTLKNVDKQMAVWLIDTGLDPGLMHPAGTNVHFDIRWLDVNMPNTSGILHKLSHRRLDLTSFRLLELAQGGDPYDCGHETTHRTTDCLNRDISEYETISNQQGQ